MNLSREASVLTIIVGAWLCLLAAVAVSQSVLLLAAVLAATIVAVSVLMVVS